MLSILEKMKDKRKHIFRAEIFIQRVLQGHILSV